MNRIPLNRRLCVAAAIATSVFANQSIIIAQEKTRSVSSIGRSVPSDEAMEDALFDDETQDENHPVSDLPKRTSFAQTRNDAMKSRSVSNKQPSVQTPKRGQSVRVTAPSSSEEQEAPTIRTASAQSRTSSQSSHRTATREGVVQAQAPMDAIYEESNPVLLGEDVDDPAAYQFQPSPFAPQQSSGLQIQFHELSPLGILLTRTQLRVEGATYWGNGYELPRLVTTDGTTVTPGSTALFGGSDVLNGSVQGVRGELGLYLDRYRSKGVLLRFFDTSDETVGFQSTPTSHPTVSRPFLSTTPSASTTFIINLAGLRSGTSNSSLDRSAYGGDILFRTLIGRDYGSKVELLAGYQQSRIDEQLSISSNSTRLTAEGDGIPLGASIQLTDRFSTSNLFHGAAIGLNSQLRGPQLSLNCMVKLGIGEMQRRVQIEGTTTTTTPLPTTNTTAEGLFARNSNSGDYVSNAFIVSPETALTLGYRINRNLEATLTYTYLGLPKVARAGQQLDPDLAVNLGNPPTGLTTPRFNLQESTFNLHSLSYGLQWRF